MSELEGNLLVCHKDDVARLPPKLCETQISTSGSAVCVFGIDSRDPATELQDHGIGLRRYFDRFYLWAPKDNLKQRQEVLNAFFDLIAVEYEALIDVPRNIENLRILLTHLKARLGSFGDSKIIDFGCGTGLALSVLSEFSMNVIGVDACLMMRRIAQSKGMVVWSPGELTRQAPNSLDGAFASYVFHLLPHTKGLRLLWARLKPGAALVANFHKNQGVEMVSAYVRELGGIGEAFEAPQSERHGMYMAYLKLEDRVDNSFSEGGSHILTD